MPLQNQRSLKSAVYHRKHLLGYTQDIFLHVLGKDEKKRICLKILNLSSEEINASIPFMCSFTP
jgi:hypothetical protein